MTADSLMSADDDPTVARIRAAADSTLLALMTAQGSALAGAGAGAAGALALAGLDDVRHAVLPAVDALARQQAEQLASLHGDVVQVILAETGQALLARSVLEVALIQRLSALTGDTPEAIMRDVLQTLGLALPYNDGTEGH